jgi:hypothetical protein
MYPQVIIAFKTKNLLNTRKINNVQKPISFTGGISYYFIIFGTLWNMYRKTFNENDIDLTTQMLK